MYEREENAPFSLISYSKERRFRVFQTLPDSWKNKKLLQVLTWFLKLVYYRDYLGKIRRNSKIHDCRPIFENYRHWLLKCDTLTEFTMSGLSELKNKGPWYWNEKRLMLVLNLGTWKELAFLVSWLWTWFLRIKVLLNISGNNPVFSWNILQISAR